RVGRVALHAHRGQHRALGDPGPEAADMGGGRLRREARTAARRAGHRHVDRGGAGAPDQGRAPLPRVHGPGVGGNRRADGGGLARAPGEGRHGQAARRHDGGAVPGAGGPHPRHDPPGRDRADPQPHRRLIGFPMRFGWLTPAHSPPPRGDHAAIAEQLEQACMAEAVGFDSVWLTEHNFTGEAVYCDPIPFASALAARTSRVRIGFAVIQLALRHPIRLAVQLALLDNLSGGRLDVGVGRGSLYNEYEFVGYGLRSDDSRERSGEALEILTRAWTEEPFSFQGKFLQVSLPALRPRVYQRPHPPIWRSVGTPASFAGCGPLGVPILPSRIALESMGARLKLYEDGLVAGGHPEPLRARLRRDVAVW